MARWLEALAIIWLTISSVVIISSAFELSSFSGDDGGRISLSDLIERRQIKSSSDNTVWIPPTQVLKFKRRYFDSLAGQSLGKRSQSPSWNGVDPVIAVETDIDPTEFLRSHLKYLMLRRV